MHVHVHVHVHVQGHMYLPLSSPRPVPSSTVVPSPFASHKSLRSATEVAQKLPVRIITPAVIDTAAAQAWFIVRILSCSSSTCGLGFLHHSGGPVAELSVHVVVVVVVVVCVCVCVCVVLFVVFRVGLVFQGLFPSLCSLSSRLVGERVSR